MRYRDATRIVWSFGMLGVFLTGCGSGGNNAGTPDPPDTTPPMVIRELPKNSSTYVNRYATILVVIAASLDPASVTASNFRVRDSANQPVSGVLSYEGFTCFSAPPPNCGHQVFFKPQSALAFGGQYTVTVTQIRNRSGLVLASDFTWSFTVIPVGIGAWQSTTTTNAPSARYGHTAVWSGNQVIVWGGADAGSLTTADTGGRYDAATDVWQATATSGAPLARYRHTAIWTGTEMIVWGGRGAGAVGLLNTGGRYDPVADTWVGISLTGAPAKTADHSTLWTGNTMIVWGGDPYRNSGGIYDPVLDSWQSTSLFNAPSGRMRHAAVWTGSETIIWGGSVAIGGMSSLTDSGGRYDPVTDTWSAMSTLGAPEPRASHTAVWTGSRMIVWGGVSTDAFGVEIRLLNSGGIYDPATDTWQAIPLADAPPGRVEHTAVWIGNEMIIWGGTGDGAEKLNSGARYNPATLTWMTTSNIDVPSSRAAHSAVWTGTQMIAWGGRIPTGINGGTNTGGRYSP